MAKVIPLPKNTDRTDPDNIRPISSLYVLSKPLERHVHDHLCTLVEKHKLFRNLQSGFRSKHSCHAALPAMICGCLLMIDKKELCF